MRKLAGAALAAHMAALRRGGSGKKKSKKKGPAGGAGTVHLHIHTKG